MRAPSCARCWPSWSAAHPGAAITVIAGIIVVGLQRDYLHQPWLHAKLLLVKGRVEKQGEVIHVLAFTLERLGLPSGEEVPVRSRDFH